MQLARLVSANLLCRELCRRTRLVAGGIVLSIALLPHMVLHAAEQQEADALVQRLSGLPAELPLGPFSRLCSPAPAPCPLPPLPPNEAKRQSIYDQLFGLGSASVPALARALGSQDVSLRRNAALALGVLGGGWWTSPNRAKAKVDISAALPALMIALQDPDSRTRGLAAQDLGDIGERAAVAVPGLVKLLAADDGGLRNSACIGLRGIGSPAGDALPALRSALSDPSRDVRRFAELAIASIEGRLSQ
jgi:HEAT repeat protein